MTAVATRDTTIHITGNMTSVGLQLPSNIDFDEWAKVGKTLGAMRTASPWAIGDWLVFGEHTYGEKFSQAADVTGMKPDSLQVYQWVASQIPMEIRRTDLTHAHHQAVARLEPEEIQKWLEKAAKQGWSVSELRSALREKRAKGAKSSGEESTAKFKVTLVFDDDPGEEFLEKLEGYVGRQGGSIKKAGW